MLKSCSIDKKGKKIDIIQQVNDYKYHQIMIENGQVLKIISLFKS